MAENREGQEKTEQATQKRLEEARLRGQVAKSMDMTTAMVILFGGVSVFVFGAYSVESFRGFMDYIFANSSQIELNDTNFLAYYPRLLLFLAKILLPILLVVFGIIFLSEVSQVGLKVAWKKFSEFEDFKKIFRIGPGLKRIFFSGRSMFELGKSVAKIGIIAIAIAWRLNSRIEELVGLAQRPVGDIGEVLLSICLEVLLTVGIVFAVIAVIDFLYQRYRFREDMKMTKHEVKEEAKQMEGDPKVKGRLRQLMRSRIRNLMLQNAAKADVVVTNPTHFAVALSYRRGEMDAPVCVAKGVDFLALRIREIAAENEIPIVEDPPLARQLYREMDIDQPVPETMYKAVAKILAYVYSLDQKQQKNQ